MCKNDYVTLKNRYKHKKHDNLKYAWVVMQVLDNHSKRKYIIKNIFNIFTNEELQVNEGRIKRFHKPLFRDPELTLQSEATRIANLDGLNDMQTT